MSYLYRSTPQILRFQPIPLFIFPLQSLYKVLVNILLFSLDWSGIRVQLYSGPVNPCTGSYHATTGIKGFIIVPTNYFSCVEKYRLKDYKQTFVDLLLIYTELFLLGERDRDGHWLFYLL